MRDSGVNFFRAAPTSRGNTTLYIYLAMGNYQFRKFRCRQKSHKSLMETFNASAMAMRVAKVGFSNPFSILLSEL